MKIKLKDFVQNSKNTHIEKLHKLYNLEVNENSTFKAIFLEDFQLLELLYHCGVDLNEKINNTYPLHFAAFRGNLEIFKFIYSKVKTIDLKTLSTAILNNKEDIFDFILREVKTNQVEMDLNGYIDEKFTPLALAVMVNNNSIVKKLLKMGVEVDRVELKRGDTPLMLAINAGKQDTITLLLEHQANPNFIAKDGFTPLIVAAYIGDLETVKTLLKYNTDIFYVTKEGFNALKIAISNNKTNVVTFLQTIYNN